MSVQKLLGLSQSPVAIGFLDAPPAGVEKWNDGPAPAGCRFWRIAAEGRSFYTIPNDHYNCAVGSYTHAIALPAERSNALQDTVGFMVTSGYIEIAEVPGIPTMKKTPAAIAYAPVDQATFTPDVVLVAAKPYAAMLIYESALRAGAGDALTNVIGRPGCAVLPLTFNSSRSALSFGCKGNRTFTGLPDEEMYVAIPGAKWPAVEQQVVAIQQANHTMEDFYKAHEQRVANGA